MNLLSLLNVLKRVYCPSHDGDNLKDLFCDPNEIIDKKNEKQKLVDLTGVFNDLKNL